MITYGPGMDAKLADPNWRAARRAASALPRTAPMRPSSMPLGPMQQMALYGPSQVVGATTRIPLGPMQQVFAAGPGAAPTPTTAARGMARMGGVAMSMPAQALLGLGMAGWHYGAPREGMMPADYTYDAMGGITGLADTPMSAATQGGYPETQQRFAPMPEAPPYPPHVMAEVARRRAMMDAAITAQLNRDSGIRETVYAMPDAPEMNMSSDYPSY